MATWFQRIAKGINTRTHEKMETPDGLWHKCKNCKKTYLTEELKKNNYVCTKCNYYERVGSAVYFDLLFDNAVFEVLFDTITSRDYLNFTDSKTYENRLKDAQTKTNLPDSMQCATGLCNNQKLTVACMEFEFIGGSMGSLVGEKIANSVDYAIANKTSLLIISRSGGARMMESAFSLMQMAKAAAKLTQLSAAQLPYISLMTDPTTGGVTASYAMLGDLNIAEPKALIGFAGPRIIKETIKKDLPKGFQTSEFLLEHGFLDFIVERKDLKAKISSALRMLTNNHE